eukprot:CAMPEP_0178383780 /NCGR_PEP_ID=MMETSP0689_2-20121128/7175_1 /TAXON_ID=160604 /ORGANISM="Amphidinium massartii, Strain CS-259" /LENGTH=768 /DNA_ID=CAMNT_0020004005 /DNA_START=115 /DNA_END=2418 /DNA_ORIENTATION=+
MEPAVSSTAAGSGKTTRAPFAPRKLGKAAEASTESHPSAQKLDTLLRKDLEGNAGKFWEALKAGVASVHGSSEAAFKAYAGCKDGAYGRLSFPKFQLLCESVNLHVEPSILRSLFEMPLMGAGGHRWTLRDFQDTLQTTSLEKVKGKLTEYTQSQSVIKTHIDALLKIFALQSGEQNQRRAVARFQQKLTLNFCMELRAALKEWSYTSRSNEISCGDFIARAKDRTTFMEYEEDFLANFFDRIDRAREGRVSIHDVVVSLTLIGTEITAIEKLWLLFTIFDLDADGCLTPEEILHMFCSISIHAVIARGDQHALDADMLFGDELSLSKAKRLFEATSLHLAQVGVRELCTFQELSGVMTEHSFLLKELIPGTFRVMWVLQPVAGAGLKNKQLENKAKRAGKESRAISNVGMTHQSSTATTANVSPALKAHRHTVAQGASSQLRTQTAASSPQVGFAGGHGASSKKTEREESYERFRIHAALRFRHAVRGEWDVVEAMRNSDQPSGPDFSGKLLPSLSSMQLPGGSVAGSPSISLQEIERTARERIEVPSHLHKRSNAWRDEHKKTLSSWSKMDLGLNDVEAERQRHLQKLAAQGASLAPRHLESAGSTTSGTSLWQSRSVPNLRPEAVPSPSRAREGKQPKAVQFGGPQQQPSSIRSTVSAQPALQQSRSIAAGSSVRPSSPSTSASVVELKAAAADKMADMVQETTGVLDETPLKDQRFGKESVWRLKALAQIDEHHQRHHHSKGRMAEKLEYECHLCRGMHTVTVA